MMSDDNEQPLLGGLLVTDYGKGRYIHCALNLFLSNGQSRSWRL